MGARIGRRKPIGVQAILTNERINQEIRLSQSHHALNDTAPAVDDASVSVEANGVVYEFEHDPLDPGLYKSKAPFAILANLRYTLRIAWQDSLYTASSRLSSVAPLQEVRFNPVANRDSLLQFADFVPIFHGTQQAMYELTVDWSHLVNEGPSRARVYYYTFNTVHINEFVRPRREKVFFPRGSIVIARKYGLNDDFAAFLRSMVIETDWNGNFYFVPAANLPSNISPEAFGFFSTCAVVSDTILAE